MVTLQDFVEARLYPNVDEVVRDAVRHLLRGRPDLRVRLAIHRYRTEDLSLAKAASLAGVSWAQMRDIVLEHGIPLRLGLETLPETEQEIEALRAYFQTQP